MHTGYEWNKYNQTHYDEDNPPPKVVRGYKFNIFYPDLIDKTKTPTYKIIKDQGYPETVVLKFSAGPPYEDVAFRIVNREWELSHRRGCRSSFDKGVLQLHFQFRVYSLFLNPIVGRCTDMILFSVISIESNTCSQIKYLEFNLASLF